MQTLAQQILVQIAGWQQCTSTQNLLRNLIYVSGVTVWASASYMYYHRNQHNIGLVYRMKVIGFSIFIGIITFISVVFTELIIIGICAH